MLFEIKRKREEKIAEVSMGLDVYAGCLVRYYSRNWLTSVQQWGIDNGIEVNVVRAGSGETAPVEDIITGVTEWREAILQGLEGHIAPNQLWNEDNDITPYYTHKPDWCAFEALQLYVAAKFIGETVPQTIPKDFNVFEHKIYKRYMKTKQSGYSLFDCEWWLPLAETIMFPAKLPTGHERMFGTVGLLQAELKEINAVDWKADKQTILSWTETEGYPTDGYSRDGKVEIKEKHTEYDTVSLAKFAFSILWQAVRHARKHGTIILLDY